MVIKVTFTHLHNHCEFSLLDGATKVDDLVEKVAKLEQPAVALTDHGWVAGGIKLTKACREKDIKPIIGSELYVAPNDMTKPGKSGENFHLTVLCQNVEGYHNLCMLSSLAYIEGFHYRPRIDKRLLTEYAEGLIVLSGCVGAELPQLLIHGKEREARKLIDYYLSTFGERFFIEVMSHGSSGGVDHVREEDEEGNVLMEEHELNDALVDLARVFGVPIVATNDAHYLEREHGEAQDALMCLAMGAWKVKNGKDKPGRLKFPGVDEGAWEFYVKSRDEMLDASDEEWWEEACDNSVLVADMIEPSVIPMTEETILPDFEIPEDVIDSSAYKVFKRTGLIL